jgi:hypothetical protein
MFLCEKILEVKNFLATRFIRLVLAGILAAIAAPLPPLLLLPQVPLLRHCYPFLGQPVLPPACVQFLWLGLRY